MQIKHGDAQTDSGLFGHSVRITFWGPVFVRPSVQITCVDK